MMSLLLFPWSIMLQVLRAADRADVHTRLQTVVSFTRRAFHGNRSLGFSSRARIAAALIVTLPLAVCQATLAQRSKALATTSASLTRYVPGSAKLLVLSRRLDEMDSAMQRAHAWRLLPVLSGAAGTGEKSFNLRRAITGYLGLNATGGLKDFMRSEIALVSDSTADFVNGVWIVRVPDEDALNRWFPSGRRTTQTTIGPVQRFRTDRGLMVCVRDNVAAMSRRSGPESLFDQVTALMTGPRNDPLDQSTEYREMLAHLPARPLAILYMLGDRQQTTSATELISWAPAIERAVIGLYEGGGGVNVAVRAALAEPRDRPPLTLAAVDRFMGLPHTTLLATATTLDPTRAFEAAARHRAPGGLGQYLMLMAGLFQPPDGQTDPQPILGPAMIFAWGQDLRADSVTPQAAIMVQCSPDQTVRGQARRVADRLIQLVRVFDTREAVAALEIDESRHLGVPIMSIPLSSFSDASRLPLGKLVRNLEPAWSVWNGWLIVALHRDHVERILDSQLGLAPRLGGVADIGVPRGSLRNRSELSIVQPDLATNVLDQWLKAYDAGDASLLDPALWIRGRRTDSSQTQRLGIGMTATEQAGVVSVARVYSHTTADGRLEPGDLILGVGDRLLDLESPNADLRRLWLESVVEPGPSLRIMRSGRVMEVVLPKPPTMQSTPKLAIGPADAVRELASLARTLQFASYTARIQEGKHYTARLSLRFTAARVSTTADTR